MPRYELLLLGGPKVGKEKFMVSAKTEKGLEFRSTDELGVLTTKVKDPFEAKVKIHKQLKDQEFLKS